MAARRTTKARAAVTEPQYTCRDCSHTYDWHEIGFDGKPFMCRCPYYTEGRFCRFLHDPQCQHFNLRNNATSE